MTCQSPGPLPSISWHSKLYPRTDIHQKLGTPKKGASFRLADSFIVKARGGSPVSPAPAAHLFLAHTELVFGRLSPAPYPYLVSVCPLESTLGRRYFPSQAERSTALQHFLVKGVTL